MSTYTELHKVWHLSVERIAEFDDAPPSTEEAAHLTECTACRADRDAMQALLSLARVERDELAGAVHPRLSEWGPLSAALHSEGLLTFSRDQRNAQRPFLSQVREPNLRLPAWLASAAALLLLLGGVSAGRVSAGASWLSFARTAPSARSTDATNRFTSITDATETLNSAQRQYEQASLWLAANDTTVRKSDVYRARLAALDQMMAASRAALQEAPQDPVLSRYLVAATQARQATLQQLSGALPVDKTIEGY